MATMNKEDEGQAAERTLSLRLVGPRGRGQAVDARDFADLVSAAIECLRCLERESGSEASVYYRLVGLELGSAVVTILPESKEDGHSTASEVATGFERGFRALGESKIAETSFGVRTQQSFAGLQRALRRGNEAVELTGRAKHRLDSKTVSRKPRTQKQEVKSVGSVSGRVEALNIHDKMVCYVYPDSGPARITCRFTEDILDQVTAAIGRYVTVHGTIDYDSTGTFPARVAVEQIDVHDFERPRLKDLFGLTPDLTDGVESAAYIRAKRDAEG